MAKLSVSRIFDVAQIATTKIYGDIQGFVEYVNQLSDNVVRILTNGVSLKDNVDCQILKLDLRDQISQTITVNKSPIEVRVQRQIPITPMITAFAWQISSSGELQVQAKFDTVPANPVEVTFIAHFS